jgi:hypothetical protein
MAAITNQWLKGLPSKRRPHHPVRVRVLVDMDYRSLFSQRGVGAVLKAQKEDGYYQAMYLSAKDISDVLPTVASFAIEETRISLATDVLAEISNEQLCKFLEELFARRARVNDEQR